MPKPRNPKTVKNMQKVFENLVAFVKDNEQDIELVAEGLDKIQADFYVEVSDKTKPTVEGLEETWEYLMDEARNDETARKDISSFFNGMLDEFLSRDFFGTEGQCDPRGDHRD